MKIEKGSNDAKKLGMQKKLPFFELCMMVWRRLGQSSVRAARRWKRGDIPSTSDRTGRKIKKTLISLYGEEKTEDIWLKLQKEDKFRNPALSKQAALLGSRSEAFMKAIITDSPVSVMSVAVGIDPEGNPLGSDLARFLPRIDPTFLSLNFRYHLAKSILRGKESVVDLGCGNMLPLRLLWSESHGRLFPNKLPSSIVACDTTRDEKMAKSCSDFAQTLSRQGVNLSYVREDLFVTLEAIQSRGETHDVVLANGIMAYLDDMKRRRLLELIMSVLRPGGIAMLDLQFKGWVMDVNIDVRGWSADVRMNNDIDEAVEEMRQLTKGLPVKKLCYYTHPYLKNRFDLFEVLFSVEKSA